MANYSLPAKTFAFAYAMTFVAFLAIDSVWLVTMAERLYRPAIGELLAAEFRLVPALLFYLIYIGGLSYLAVRPGLIAGSVKVAIISGAVLGLTAYGTYDLTNQATLKVWPASLTVIDLIWGTVLSAAAAGISCALTRRFMPLGPRRWY